MASDLLSTLKSYLTKVADGEHTPAELAATLNMWIKESTESIKLKVEDEVQRSVSKMGFIKRVEFDEVKRELMAVRSELASLTSSSSPVAQVKKKSAAKKIASKAKVAKLDSAAKVKSTKKVAAPKKAPKKSTGTSKVKAKG